MARRQPIDVKALQDAHGLTQEELAKEIGIDRKTLQRWKKGTSRPSQLARQALKRLTSDAKMVETSRTTPSVMRKPLTPSESASPRGVIPGLS